ncbi:glycosyltransferase family 1 protein [Romboutsia weinsteinii]|uniref:Glycosyltransferase family 1 protein n=1 Tax=Romboutsia weinsteinii TaxID=2020949 RepID=A0A371J3Z7_9FIRM|nr:glycosyltransferase family 4 protein [Romboutsia weinsteinii]RDY27394.1 glycosyltransferase family 1 protein [Romboutsia weinsteinii]
MKKILFIATVQSHIMNFHIPYIKRFQKMGYEVHVATKLDLEKYRTLDKDLGTVVWKNIDFSRNPISMDLIKSYKQLDLYLKQNKFDLIHTHTPIAAFIARLVAKNNNFSPILYTAHGFHFFKGAPIQNWIIYYPLEKIASRWTDGIITMNEEDYSRAKSKFKNRRCNIYKINGIGVDLEKYTNNKDKAEKNYAKFNLKENDFVVSIIGEINKNKNQKMIIDAVEILRKKDKNIKLLIVGEGDMSKDIEKYIYDNNLDDAIQMLGFRKDIPDILNISNIIVSCSYREGLPKNLIEAMSARKPVICTNIRGNKDLVDNMENGILVDIDDVDNMANSIELLYDDKSLLETMERQSYEISTNYSLDKVICQMDKIYSEYL